MTEQVHFNFQGLRDKFYIELLELIRNNKTFDGFQKIAVYDTENGLQLLRDFATFETQTTQNMQNKVFKVIMHEGMPFLRKKYVYLFNLKIDPKWPIYFFPDRTNVIFSENQTMNDMYEGFAKDLLERIAANCRFKYEISIEKDYGKENPVTKQWNGKFLLLEFTILSFETLHF